METRKQIKRYILNNFLFSDDANMLADTTSLIGDKVVDSTGMLELIMYLEETFGISIADTEMIPENLDSVERISQYVAFKLDSTVDATAGGI